MSELNKSAASLSQMHDRRVSTPRAPPTARAHPSADTWTRDEGCLRVRF